MREQIPLARLVLGWGLANKSEVFVRALLVLAHREGKPVWALATLRRYVTRTGWLEDLADVYITYCHDTLLLYGPSMDLRYHHIPKIDQLNIRYYKVFEQAKARLLKRGDSRYQHHQFFVLPDMFKKGATAADKKGILAGKGGDWKLDRAGTPVNPETTLASSVVGWHSKKTVKIMTAQNTTIPPRETVIDGEVFQSPNIYGKRKSHLVGRIEHLNQSWATGGWRKRLEKYLKSQPFQKGFLVREPLREAAVGMPVRCYFPEQDEPHWGEVVEYDAEPEYYVVVFEDGEIDEMVWVQLQSYLHKHKKTPQEAQVARRAKNQRRLERAKEDEKTLAALKAKRARYEQRTKEKITLARTTPEENRELLEKVNEKNKAKRARKKERKRLAKKGD